jgi:hypothetical protein
MTYNISPQQFCLWDLGCLLPGLFGLWKGFGHEDDADAGLLIDWR